MNTKHVRVEAEIAGIPLILETGQVARQAHGAVIATLGGTMTFAAIAIGPAKEESINVLRELAEGKKHWAKADGLTSIYGSNKIVDEFNVKNTVYKAPEKVDEYLDSTVSEEALK